MAGPDEPERNRRIGIPNIPAGTGRWYLTVFTVITTYLTLANTLFVVTTEQITGWQAIQYVATGEILKAGGVALITSPIIVEVGRMVIAGMWSERRERRAREQGRAEGEERANQRWEEWNQRRLQAEAHGETFTEPPPRPENRE